MTNQAKNKQQFRSSKTWKSFRSAMGEKNKIDYITHKKLLSGWQLHHADMREENYNKLDDIDNFFCLNSATHDCIHFLFRYYKDSPEVLYRLKEVLDKMVELNHDPEKPYINTELQQEVLQDMEDYKEVFEALSK